MVESQHKIHLLSQYQEGELSPNERVGVERHLAHCAFCRQELSLLRQAVAALEELPLEETPVSFLAKLNRRLEQDEQARNLEEQRRLSYQNEEQQSAVSAAPPLSSESGGSAYSLLARGVRRLWRSLFCPVRLKLPLYATAVGGVVTVLVFHSPVEKLPIKQEADQPRTEMPQVPSKQDLVSAASKPEQSEDLEAPTVKPPPVPSVPLADREGTLIVVEPLVWQVAGRQPQALQERAKVLAKRIPEAVIIREGEEELVLSLPTEAVASFRQELGELGQVNTAAGKPDSNTPSTVVHLRFVFTLKPSPLSVVDAS